MHAEDGLPPIPRAVASQQNLEIIMLVKDVQNLPGVLPVNLSSPLSRAPQVQCAVACCAVLQRVNALQCVAVCCSVLPGVLLLHLSSPLNGAPHVLCVVVCCSMLQRAAAC